MCSQPGLPEFSRGWKPDGAGTVQGARSTEGSKVGSTQGCPHLQVGAVEGVKDAEEDFLQS